MDTLAISLDSMHINDSNVKHEHSSDGYIDKSNPSNFFHPRGHSSRMMANPLIRRGYKMRCFACKRAAISGGTTPCPRHPAKVIQKSTGGRWMLRGPINDLNTRKFLSRKYPYRIVCKRCIDLKEMCMHHYDALKKQVWYKRHAELSIFSRIMEARKPLPNLSDDYWIPKDLEPVVGYNKNAWTADEKATFRFLCSLHKGDFKEIGKILNRSVDDCKALYADLKGGFPEAMDIDKYISSRPWNQRNANQSQLVHFFAHQYDVDPDQPIVARTAPIDFFTLRGEVNHEERRCYPGSIYQRSVMMMGHADLEWGATVASWIAATEALGVGEERLPATGSVYQRLLEEKRKIERLYHVSNLDYVTLTVLPILKAAIARLCEAARGGAHPACQTTYIANFLLDNQYHHPIQDPLDHQ